MATVKKYLVEYRKTLINRKNVPLKFADFLEECIKRNPEAAKNSFHKIMVHNWTETAEELFPSLTEFIGAQPFVPVKFSEGIGISSFYTNDLNIVLKALNNDFLFPCKKYMFSFDIMFNDKNCEELFGVSLNLNDVIESVVSNRFSIECELNLSDFCRDQDLTERNIYFYKLSLLSGFNALMTRMGRDTKILNLSNNNLSEIPYDILNYFIKGDLKELNLSRNNLSSLEDVTRVTSKLERLWLEGNPLCENVTQHLYLKNITTKFPNIKELDGLTINQHGIKYPFWKNYIADSLSDDTHYIVDKFLTLYFSHYDYVPRNNVSSLYHDNAVLTINTTFSEYEEVLVAHYSFHASDVSKAFKKQKGGYRIIGKNNIGDVICNFPVTKHDPSTFTIDVLENNRNCLILVVDGIYKETSYQSHEIGIFQFRRVFVLVPIRVMSGTVYLIRHETFSISFATKDMIDISFKTPIVNKNSLSLLNPTEDECTAIIKAFQHVTGLKTFETKSRLSSCKWDIKLALEKFCDELRVCSPNVDRFIRDDCSDEID